MDADGGIHNRGNVMVVEGLSNRFLEVDRAY